MIIQHQDNVAAHAGGHTYWFLPAQIISGAITVTTAAVLTVLPLVKMRVFLGQYPNNKTLLSLSMADDDIRVRVTMVDISLEVH